MTMNHPIFVNVIKGKRSIRTVLSVSNHHPDLTSGAHTKKIFNQGEKKRTCNAQIDTENQGCEYLRSTSSKGFQNLKRERTYMHRHTQERERERCCVFT